MVINPPVGVGAFQFVVLAALRTAQLTRGCLPRIDGTHKATVTAQFEIAQGKITQMERVPAVVAVDAPP
jgi:DNA-directed RNA polymerase subunit K/omega